MHFRLLPKSMTLDDLEQPLLCLLHNEVFFRANHENLNKDRPITSAAKM